MSVLDYLYLVATPSNITHNAPFSDEYAWSVERYHAAIEGAPTGRYLREGRVPRRRYGCR